MSYILNSLLAQMLAAQVQPQSDKNTQKIKIACVGDSITYGGFTNEDERKKACYPAQLQKLLGDKYEVGNFGSNAATASTEGSKPYIKTEEFRKAQVFNPDIVFIMLGTNDSKKEIWGHPDKIKEGFKTITNAFKKQNPNVKLCLCTPPAVEQGHWGIQSKVVASGIHDLILSFGQEENIHVIDVFKTTHGVMKISRDGVHLKAAGNKIMSNDIAKEIPPPPKQNSGYIR